MKAIASVLLAVLVNGASSAQETPAGSDVPGLLQRAPAAELPAVAASLVARARPEERRLATVTIVRAAVQINPAATVATVGAVTRAAPEAAAWAAVAAVQEQPRCAADIVRATAATAPARAGDITTALCEVYPDQYRTLAITAARAAPAAGAAILRAVSRVRPELKSYIEQELALYGESAACVECCLDNIQLRKSVGAPIGAGLSSDPGAIATSAPAAPMGKPDPKPPHGGGPPGGRNYAKP